nr:NlpC/P60 family protein [Limosilactobacillus kribbianus]
MAALGAASALAVATTANADTQVQVKAGDTVWNYAQEYKTTVNAIVQRNQLANPDVLQIGQTLIIPDSATSATSQADTTSTAVATIVNPLSTSTAASANSTASAQLATGVVSSNSAATSQSTAVSLTSTAADLNSASQSAIAETADQQSEGSQAQTGSSAATNNYTPASGTPTTYAANSAAAHQAMSSYAISYGTVERTAAAYNSQATSQTAQAASSAAQSTTSYASQSTSNAAQSTTSTTTSSAVATAKSMIGVPYVWGGNTPSGFDCSGLVQYSYNLGSNYRTTYQQATLGQHKYDVENAQSGDLYFWGTESAPYHVAIAEGNGNYIQAPTPGQNVQEGNIQYYRPNYYISMNQ